MTRQSELPPLRHALARLDAPDIRARPAAAVTSHLAQGSAAGGRAQLHGGGSRAPAFPEIAIHAFCEANSTAEALQAAGRERRLAKVHMEVDTGGIDAALADRAQERNQDRAQDGAPDILVVETSLPRPLMLAKLNALAERCNPVTRLIVIGHVNDIALYRDLIKRGISEYLIAPVAPLQLVEAVAGLCDAAADNQAGRAIAFVGAKGGVGSSTVCHNVAWALSEVVKCEVVVADLDLAFGTAGLDFNQEAMQGMAEALHAPERLDEATLDRLLTRCSQHLSILAAPVTLDRDYDISAGACAAVLDALRQRAQFTALDLPHVWTPWLRQVLTQSDEIVITAAPDLANLRNARNLVDVLEASRTSGNPPQLVINMARRPRRPDIPAEELAAAIDLDPTLVIEFDGETFGLAANNGQMIEEYSRKARAAQQFRTLASALAQRSEPKEAAKSSPLAPILGKLRLRA